MSAISTSSLLSATNFKEVILSSQGFAVCQDLNGKTNLGFFVTLRPNRGENYLSDKKYLLRCLRERP